MPENNIAFDVDAEQSSNFGNFYTRQQFLTDLGLQWDPFITPVAEQELMRLNLKGKEKSNRPLPLSYFVPPTNLSGDNLLPALQEEKPAFVFGNPGMGKTILRLALAATGRRLSGNTLIITYLIREKTNIIPSATTHKTLLSQELAIDLFLQVLEQFTPGLDQPGEEQITQLGNLLALAERPLQRLARSILQQPPPTSMMGLASRWPMVDRMPIRHVDKSPELEEVVQAVLAASLKSKINLTGEDAWQFGIETARLWQFKQLFILVDGVDTHHRTADRMFALIKPLLEETAVWETKHIFGKYFLPAELETAVQQFLSQLSIPTQSESITHKLQWDSKSLRRLLVSRFSAAASRRVSFNDLVSPTWDANLDQLLITEAKGSPRRLLQLITTLIDTHINYRMSTSPEILQKDPNETYRFITEAQWQQTVAVTK